MLEARKFDRTALSPVLEILGGEWCMGDTGSREEPQTETGGLGALLSFDFGVLMIILSINTTHVLCSGQVFFSLSLSVFFLNPDNEL